MKKSRISIVLLFALISTLFNGTIPSDAKQNYVRVSKSISIKQGSSETISVKKLNGVKIKSKTFKSKNKKIATVTKKGKVTGKRAGSAKVTAKVKYTVKKKNYSKTFTVKVKVKALSKTGDATDAKANSDSSGQNNSQAAGTPVASVLTPQGATAVPTKVPETTASSRPQADEGGKELPVATEKTTDAPSQDNKQDSGIWDTSCYTNELRFYGAVGEDFKETVYYGISNKETYEISSLPDGLSQECDGSDVVIKGVPKKAGTFEVVLSVYENDVIVRKKTCYFAIGSDVQIAGAALPVYTLEQENVYPSFGFTGGSGSYKYTITDDGGINASLHKDLDFDSYYVRANAQKAGTYTIKVKATDVGNAELSAEISIPVYVAPTITVRGKIKSEENIGMPYERTNICFINKNKYARVSSYVYVDEDITYSDFTKEDGTTDEEALLKEKERRRNGEYEVRLAAGTYDITFDYCPNYGSAGEETISLAKGCLATQKITDNSSGVDINLPLYRFIVYADCLREYDDGAVLINDIISNWYIESTGGRHLHIPMYCNLYGLYGEFLKDSQLYTFLPEGDIPTLKTEKIVDSQKQITSTLDEKTYDEFNGCLYTETTPMYHLETTQKDNLLAYDAYIIDDEGEEEEKMIPGVKNTTYTAEEGGSYYLDDTYTDDYSGCYYGYKFVPDETGVYELYESNVTFYTETGVEIDRGEDGYSLTKNVTYFIAKKNMTYEDRYLHKYSFVISRKS